MQIILDECVKHQLELWHYGMVLRGPCGEQPWVNLRGSPILLLNRLRFNYLITTLMFDDVSLDSL